MSRTLNARQKKLLDKAFSDGATDVESLPYETWKKLEAINDHETLWQNANRYLWDKMFEDIRADRRL